MSAKTLSWMGLAAAVLVICSAERWSVCNESQAGPPPSRPHSAGEIWFGLLQRQPYPYLVPLPEPKRSAVDGTYTKVVAAKAERVHCLRCPDYAPEGGVWKLNLDQGVLRIFHPESRWKSMASYLVAGDRILLANDPTCIDLMRTFIATRPDLWNEDIGR